MASQESHRKLDFIDLKKKKSWCSFSWHRKIWGNQREHESPEKCSLLVLSFPDTCRDADTAIAGAIERVCSLPVSPPSSKDSLLHTPCICRGSGSSQPGFPGVGNGRNGKQCLCCADAPTVCFPGEQCGLPRLVASLEFQDAFSRWSNLPLPRKCHCLENKEDASAIFCKHCDRDGTTASCHSGIPLFRENILSGKNE